MFGIIQVKHSRVMRTFVWVLVSIGGSFTCRTASASNYGFSVDINFGAKEAITGPAGLFSTRIWNNFDQLSVDTLQRVRTDSFGQIGKQVPQIRWQADSLEYLTSLKPPANENDGRLLRGFLNRPRILITGLDQVVPPDSGPLNYSLLLYTFGAKPGLVGTYNVLGRSTKRQDVQEFTGKFRPGSGGNMVIFEDLNSPILAIDTEGFAPVNALSIMYCRPGDVNGDGVVDVTDLNVLNGAVKDGTSKPGYDINIDLNVDFNDVMAWIKWSKGTCVGDVNLDGTFDSDDLVQLFQTGNYETGGTATWVTGDWNGDCKFDSNDLLLAFQEGCYEGGVVALDESTNGEGAFAVSALPEPASSTLLVSGLLVSLLARRRSHASVAVR